MRDILSFDVETTGLDLKEDRIIQIALARYSVVDNKLIKIRSYSTLVNPEGKLSTQEALAVHGIPDEVLLRAPTFKDVFENVKDYFKDADLHGYNISVLDIPILFEELKRLGVKLNLSNRDIYDSFNIECRENKRTLGNVYERMFNEPIDGAHDAEVDVNAAVRILEKQIELYGIEKCKETLYEPSGLLEKREGKIYFCKGKYKDQPLVMVFKNHMDYIDWMLKSDFSDITKNIIIQYKELFLKINQK